MEIMGGRAAGVQMEGRRVRGGRVPLTVEMVEITSEEPVMEQAERSRIQDQTEQPVVVVVEQEELVPDVQDMEDRERIGILRTALVVVEEVPTI
jgi:hypothetical protein